MTDVSVPQRHARLLGAYWLDSPVLPHDHCVCCERLAPPVSRSRRDRGPGVRGPGLRGVAVALAVLVIAAAVAMAPL
ncbi:hypothetical protein ACFYP4_21295 [Streptomyces sp. NPDC005551]|uniref:hypothetical protein n=1 Tax=unclassified Streptomyces TaxID=2593676 RepID=UPI0033DE038F